MIKVSLLLSFSELGVNAHMHNIEALSSDAHDDFMSPDRLQSPAPANENNQLMSPIAFTSRPHTEQDQTSTISAHQVISDEQMRATEGMSVENRERVTLRGTEESQRRQFFQFLVTTPGQLLRVLPRLSIVGNNAIDAGGVFRHTINRHFKILYDESDIFVTTSNTRTFRERPAIEFEYHRDKYYVLGKIFYWFIFIHRQIPYPTDIDAAIIAFAIHGRIPRTILPQLNAAIDALVGEILTYNARTSINRISDNVKGWLSTIGIPLDDFVTDLHDSRKGPMYLADRVGSLAIMNNSLQAFQYFRNGFNKDRGFESV
jgi:hypothetical protein